MRLVLVSAKAAGQAVALPKTGSLQQANRDLAQLHIGQIQGHNLVALDVNHQIDVQPHIADRSRQETDVS